MLSPLSEHAQIHRSVVALTIQDVQSQSIRYRLEYRENLMFFGSPTRKKPMLRAEVGKGTVQWAFTHASCMPRSWMSLLRYCGENRHSPILILRKWLSIPAARECCPGFCRGGPQGGKGGKGALICIKIFGFSGFVILYHGVIFLFFHGK